MEIGQKYFSPAVTHTTPEGGIFLWAELPKKATALDLFDLAVKDKVIFVPGDHFYGNKLLTQTMRLNFSCVDEATIETGISRLGAAIRELLQKMA